VPSAAWLLVTTMWIGQPAAATPIAASPATSTPNQPHELGFGGMLGVGPLGTGVAMRWFAGYVGLDTRFLLSRSVNGIGLNGAFSYEVAPSVIVMLTKADATRPFEFRPYVGGGVNHVRAGTNAVETGSPVSGSGTQVFGGLEVQIRQADSIALGFEVIDNRRSAPLRSAGVSGGVTGTITFVFYVK
jgi:hypothetical protein